ncbi:MAG TPA: sulfite exporter TauE/SafE family protein [Steroidobacteraceae bacterium]|nr:sulfite exporter TauE/SafE family protein [Steroidobacteraceae bacterium]
MAPEVPWLVGVGFIAQLIDGCVGTGYGISSSAILATLGVPPAITSATVHAAEVVTAGVSSASHAWFRNIDRRIFFSLLVPGVIGGVLGAGVLAHAPVHAVRPFIWAYLIATSLVVLGRVLRRREPLAARAQGPALGAIAGFLDAIGGGGWGTIVSSTMIARGVTPRFAIGTSNAVICFVALAISLTLWTQIGKMRYDMVIALLIGGAAAAPLAAWVTRHVPHRVAATAVGLVVFALGATGLVSALR